MIKEEIGRAREEAERRHLEASVRELPVPNIVRTSNIRPKYRRISSKHGQFFSQNFVPRGVVDLGALDAERLALL